MKKGILYILLFIYASMMAKPLLPYVADAISHALFYKDHLAIVHFENGNYHVHKEAGDAAKENSDATKSSLFKKQTSPDHIIQFPQQITIVNARTSNFQEYLLPPHAIIFIGQHFTPPRPIV